MNVVEDVMPFHGFLFSCRGVRRVRIRCRDFFRALVGARKDLRPVNVGVPDFHRVRMGHVMHARALCQDASLLRLMEFSGGGRGDVGNMQRRSKRLLRPEGGEREATPALPPTCAVRPGATIASPALVTVTSPTSHAEVSPIRVTTGIAWIIVVQGCCARVLEWNQVLIWVDVTSVMKSNI